MPATAATGANRSPNASCMTPPTFSPTSSPTSARRGLDLPQHLSLDVQLLEHGLDDELGAAEPGVTRVAREQSDQPGVFVLGDASPPEPIVEDLARSSEPLCDPRQVGVLHAYVHASLRAGG